MASVTPASLNLTAELPRQEVHTWKKVIRIISHELNNSLAPAASLASSGAELLRRGQTGRTHDAFMIEVTDRGCGMSDTVMSNTLVPFYPTKRSGTGLSLALAREIIQAHGGSFALGKREGGGLSVTLILPGTNNSVT
jgi:signal transduction histidine kinase